MASKPGKAKATAFSPDDINWKSEFVLARDGLKLHVAHCGNRAGSKVPLICLPGLSRNTEDFDLVGRTMAAEGDRWVVALDSRGRGASEYDSNWRNYDLTVELDDLHQVLIALGIDRAAFLGTSRGGLLTALTSITKPQLIAGAILNDIGPIIEARGLARIRGYIGKLPAPKNYDEAVSILKQVFGTHFTDMEPGAWERFARRTWKEEGSRLVARYDANLMRPLAELDFEKPMPDLWPQFEPLALAPMMVIRGELSDILSQATAEAMVTRHPDARLHVVPYQGHAPLLEDEPTIAAIGAFLAGLKG